MLSWMYKGVKKGTEVLKIKVNLWDPLLAFVLWVTWVQDFREKPRRRLDKGYILCMQGVLSEELRRKDNYARTHHLCVSAQRPSDQNELGVTVHPGGPVLTFTVRPNFQGTAFPSGHAFAVRPDEKLTSHQLSSFPGNSQAWEGKPLPVTVGSGSGRGGLGVAVCSITTLKHKEKAGLGTLRRPTRGAWWWDPSRTAVTHI